MDFSELLYRHFVETGVSWAILGAILAVMFGGIGSAKGLRIAGAQAAGVLSEKPDLFGKLLVLVALPGTQGFYGFICAFFIANSTGMLKGNFEVSFATGLALFFIGAGMGVVQWLSAINQGMASAASINLVAKKPEESGRSILFPALVETYAVVALLAAILLIGWVVGIKDIPDKPRVTIQAPAQEQAAPEAPAARE